MNFMHTSGVAVALAMGIGVAACAAEPLAEEDSNVPEVSLDGVGEQDQGTSWNGWKQQAVLIASMCVPPPQRLGSIFTRYSGDSTRGGGACFVRKTTTSCSSDTTCTSAAQAQYGSQAWGYCYSSKCYLRPGSQSTCSFSPNRTAGTVYITSGIPAFQFDGNDYAYGCMTKTAGPNYACGGTNPSLYMKTVSALQMDWSGCNL